MNNLLSPANIPLSRKLSVVTATAALAIAAIASAVTLCCRVDANFHQAIDDLMTRASFIPARRWALQASFTDLAAVYYFFVWPALPLSTVWMVTRYAFPFRGELAKPVPLRDRIVLPFSALIVAGSTWLTLGMTGGDIRFLKVGTDFNQMILLGWLIFAVPGALFGVSILLGLKAISTK